MKDGGPAFPHVHGLPLLPEESISIEKREVVYHGLTLRDYFAAAAMQAMTQLHPVYATGPDSVTAARRAYEIADRTGSDRS